MKMKNYHLDLIEEIENLIFNVDGSIIAEEKGSELGKELKKVTKEMEKMKENIIIRLERENEYHEVENLVRESFWNVYRPGCLEHYVLHQLRNDPAFVPELDFVMTLDGQLIGQNMFMKAVIAADDGRSIPIMTMGPICIAP